MFLELLKEHLKRQLYILLKEKMEMGLKAFITITVWEILETQIMDILSNYRRLSGALAIFIKPQFLQVLWEELEVL